MTLVTGSLTLAGTPQTITVSNLVTTTGVFILGVGYAGSNGFSVSAVSIATVGTGSSTPYSISTTSYEGQTGVGTWYVDFLGVRAINMTSS